jgi:hypothetical protein
VPAVIAAQVPSVPPVFAAEHAMHVLVHARLQQKPFAQKPVPHVVPTLQVAPLEPPSTAASVALSAPLSDAASVALSTPLSDAASVALSAPLSDAASAGESAAESVVESPAPASFTSAVEVSPPLFVSCVASLPVGESCPVVPSRTPPSCGILLRSKSTSSSQPGIAATATVAAAITRLHFIERFVLIGVLVVKDMARLRTGP